MTERPDDPAPPADKDPALPEGRTGSPPPPPPASPAKPSDDQRRALLAQQLQQAATRGLRVQSATEYQAVLIEGKPINHTLHAILTVFTCLLWGIVWAVIAATGGEKRHQLIVDEFGNVHWQALGKV